jgi:HNH endonuclease
MSKIVKRDGKKYKIDGEFYIAEDESHVIYRGIKFVWLDSYYKRCGAWTKDKPCNLHRAVWEANFGPIPPGHHIHHKDGNRRNNHVENLQCLDGKLHLSRTAKKNKWIGSQENLNVLAVMREMAKPWHRTKEGIKFHRKHAKDIKFGYKPVTFERKCRKCGKDYEAHQNCGRFCSRKCKSSFRYHSGVDNENRKCVICQNYFIANRYSRSKTCSRNCGVMLWKEVRRIKA